MEVEREMHAESETESEKRVRYRHLSMDEASNPWKSIIMTIWILMVEVKHQVLWRKAELVQASPEVPGNQLHIEPTPMNDVDKKQSTGMI